MYVATRVFLLRMIDIVMKISRSVNCTVSLLRNSLRRSALLADGEYARQGSEDERFVDYFGTIQSVVTGSAQSEDEDFNATIKKEYFPYFLQGKDITINRLELYAIQDTELLPATPSGVDVGNLTTDLNDNEQFELSLSPDGTVLVREKEAQVFLLLRYSVT